MGSILGQKIKVKPCAASLLEMQSFNLLISLLSKEYLTQ